VGENIAAASALVRAAVADGAKFVATPEMTHLLQKDPVALREAVRSMDEDAGVAAFSKLAAEQSIHLLIGSLAILREDGKIANRHCLSRKITARQIVIPPETHPSPQRSGRSR